MIRATSLRASTPYIFPIKYSAVSIARELPPPATTTSSMIAAGTAVMPRAGSDKTASGARISVPTLVCLAVAAALSGGFAPVIATGLLAWAGATWPISLYLIGLGLISFIATLAAHETREMDIAKA